MKSTIIISTISRLIFSCTEERIRSFGNGSCDWTKFRGIRELNLFGSISFPDMYFLSHAKRKIYFNSLTTNGIWICRKVKSLAGGLEGRKVWEVTKQGTFWGFKRGNVAGENGAYRVRSDFGPIESVAGRIYKVSHTTLSIFYTNARQRVECSNVSAAGLRKAVAKKIYIYIYQN